jgi:ferredoxin
MTLLEEPREEQAAVEEPARVSLRFEPSGTSVRVPPGVTVFDAASWNGIAIDSTCGGHGTCKKCRVRIQDGDVPVSPLDARAFTPQEIRAGWRLACRAQAGGHLEIEVPPLVTRPKAASAGRSSSGPRCRSGTWSSKSRRSTTSGATSSGCRTRSRISNCAPGPVCCGVFPASSVNPSSASQRSWSTIC